MKVTGIKNGIRLEGLRDFYPTHLFESGQAFRWVDDGLGYVGIVGSRVVRMIYQSETLILENCTLTDFHTMWRHYFDLDKDYGRLKDILSADPVLKEAVRHGWGIRILNQDPWETLISFILSANNNIVRIRQIIERLCRCYGREIIWQGQSYYTFPGPEALAAAEERALRDCGTGYRAPYILGAARMVLDGSLPLNGLKDCSYQEAFDQMLRCTGVGPKVADCILLFSMEKGEAFPVDVWVKRIMAYYYGGEMDSDKDLKALSAKRFGSYAGLAQQYLFYYAREQKIGK